MTTRTISEYTQDDNRSSIVEHTTADGWMLVSSTVRKAIAVTGWAWSLDVTYNGTRLHIGDVRRTQRAAERELERWKKRLVTVEWL